ncbi:hypothetical protein KIH77_08165 [Bifidobacterium sp. 82T24]|uniref:hypothetical protein n=1 Tax=Bifidobacterium pluvialisilvae TaxID=2834436 RepID=UPI001C56906E|nr:hypothetical protein [Bifidobacterium pluvialisilvae]MBW3088698.1 hypothetical protein [Bifidobacterium pluvialisilvae]
MMLISYIQHSTTINLRVSHFFLRNHIQRKTLKNKGNRRIESPYRQGRNGGIKRSDIHKTLIEIVLNVTAVQNDFSDGVRMPVALVHCLLYSGGCRESLGSLLLSRHQPIENYTGESIA